MKTSVVRLLPLAFFVISAAFSVAGVASFPHERDLYNLLYEHSRPQRPESTQGFFIVFPAMQLILACGFIAFYRINVSDERRIAGTAFVIGLSLFFTAINILRFLTAWRFFS